MVRYQSYDVTLIFSIAHSKSILPAVHFNKSCFSFTFTNNPKPIITMLRTFLFTAALLCSASLFAQTTPQGGKQAVIPYGDPISLELAHQVMSAAVKEANANGWTMAIAIVDCGGNLVIFEKMDNTQVGSIEVAIGKAKTANNFKRATKVMEDAVAAGGLGMRMLAIPGVFPLEGGEPIFLNGKIISAIGVSGMQSTQDGQVVKAALSVVKK